MAELQWSEVLPTGLEDVGSVPDASIVISSSAHPPHQRVKLYE